MYFFCFFFLALVLMNLCACFCDICTLRSKRDYYPHSSRSKTSFCRVCRYSFLYNMHICNICSFRSKLVLSTFKAFWSSALFLTVFYVLELLISAKFWILILAVVFLAIIIIPFSILECCLLRRRTGTLI